MNIDRIRATLTEKSEQERARMRRNAGCWRDGGSDAQRQAAERLIVALDDAVPAPAASVYEALEPEERIARVTAAFRGRPPSETDLRFIQALFRHPDDSSSTLSRVCGWDGQAWHTHFGKMCHERGDYLWPVEMRRDGTPFWSGLLADWDDEAKTWRMKDDVRVAFEGMDLVGVGSAA
ncbi:hypothetical protein [Roseitranquillus sediminis]|uniref:hypothetical protein n=1 Tax=Roseitranquillus sediminis TaxID=2809051 RepID=UPI001D0C4165|nr:hypothetical protein [Roseitranquillus sediminis]MBM9595718.1 hypothetical protein [Roseitranquillus sediminis]